jgi:hypothetical protein
MTEARGRPLAILASLAGHGVPRAGTQRMARIVRRDEEGRRGRPVSHPPTPNLTLRRQPPVAGRPAAVARNEANSLHGRNDANF